MAEQSTYTWDPEELMRLEMQAMVTWSFLEGLARGVGLAPGATAIDLGCGPGRLAAKLAMVAGPEGTVIGVDHDAGLLAGAAAAPWPDDATTPTWIEGDVGAVDLPDGSADVVLAHMLLQHLPDPRAALDEALRLLKPGGGLVLVDIDDDLTWAEPAPADLRAFLDDAIAHQARLGGDRRIGRRLGGLAHAAGFRTIEVTPQLLTAPPFPMAQFVQGQIAFKHHLFPPEEQEAAKARIAALTQALLEPGVFGQIGIYAVTARKPR